MQKAALKYFDRYAEPQIQDWAKYFSDTSYDRVVVIPAKAEHEFFPRTYASLEKSSKALGQKNLLILVINAPLEDSQDIHSSNQTLFDWISAQGPCHRLNSQLFQIKSEFLDTIVIDCFQLPFRLPPKTGVGYARKLGADLATGLILADRIRFPFFFSTDADVEVPLHYFKDFPFSSSTSAALHPFIHLSSSSCAKEREAMRIYDLFLHSYVEGLEFAESKYAFQTIGSTQIISARSYTEVRGFPQREAGEDFYLLNKLAKVGSILNLSGEPLQLSGRISDRVPFGTGQSIQKYLQQIQAGKEIYFYDPQVFEVLKDLHARLLSWPTSASLRRESSALTALWKEFEFESALAGFSSLPSRTLQKAIFDWFDGFKTLKAIHFLRDQHFPSLPYREALEKAPWAPLKSAEIRPRMSA